MLHVKKTKAKGRTYWYFRTGQLDSKGREILARLPSQRDPGFGGTYAAYLAARTRRETGAAAAAELTVPALCDLYERSQHFAGLSEGTQRLYSISLRYLRLQLPTAPAGLVERKDVVRMVDGRADQPGAANSLLSATAALYKWGRERGHVENDPCRDVPPLKMGEHQPWRFELIEAALAADDDRVRLATHLLFYTAQRIGDVVKMRWTDIRDGRLEVRQQKTDKQLSIPLHEALRRELDRHPQQIGYIIPGVVAGRVLAQVTLRESLQAFAAARGHQVVPHGLRKNAINALLEAGCSVPEAAAISGQTMRVVEEYAKKRAQGKLASAAILKWQGAKA